MKTAGKVSHLASGCAALLALAGCSDGDVKEVKQWMATTEKQTHVSVVPLSEPKTYVPFAYAGKDLTDPYSANKLLVELARTQAKSDSLFKPDLDRKKELLESYPLDAIRMVGVLQNGNANFALLQIDSAYHQVTVGQFIGQNFGKITAVTDSAVNIREVVQDAGGEWVERHSTLELQDGKETKK